jgi:hypothetical protein
MEFLAHDPRFKSLISQDLLFKKNVSPGAHKEIEHVRSLSEFELSQVRKACMDEISLTLKKLEAGSSYLKDERIRLPYLSTTSGAAFKSIEVAVKAYHQAEKLQLTPTEFAEQFPGLDRALGGPPFHRYTDILSYLHFSKRTLVPFVCLLAMHTFFNPDTILGITWDDLRESAVYGAARSVIEGRKYRGGTESKQTRTFSTNVKHPFSPTKILDYLRIYGASSAAYIGRANSPIFCYVRRDGAFAFTQRSHDISMALQEFVKEHNLPHFTLSNFRKSGADLLDLASNHDPAVKKAVLGQQNVETTETSYESPTTKARRAETLAVTQTIRARRVETNGKIDGRGASLPDRQRVSATPGFSCLSPFESPYPGQVNGRLCTAYCCCPDCPFAATDTASPGDFARIIQVHQAITLARRIMNPRRWSVHWLPQLKALDEVWIPSFPEDVRKRSKSESFPPIPEVE